LRHRAKVAVGDLDTLRAAGRAARVEQPRGGIDLDSGETAAASRVAMRSYSRSPKTTTRSTELADPPSAAAQSPSTNAQRAPLSSRTKASSLGCSFAFTGTAIMPAIQQAKSVSM
jgi:hypothetical protein